MAAEQEGTFGSYVPNDILDQIKLRQDIHGRSLPSSTPNLENIYQSEYHNAPWVCLRSSVDVPAIEYRPGQKPPTDSGALAKQFILCGGTMQLATGEDGKSRLTFTGDSNLGAAGYGLDGTYGYRPRPGITKVQVKTKDTFGCIMEATVNFTVYSLDDLEAVDKLYFKPGMSALLEWGHSVYVLNNGEQTQISKPRLFELDKFFSSKDPYEDINKRLQDWRADIDSEGNRKSSPQFDGNYEAMFGLVTNFSWSFNNDGSYSCTVKLLSQGTILEGLQIPAKVGFDYEAAKAKQAAEALPTTTGYGDWEAGGAGWGHSVNQTDEEHNEENEYALKSPFHWIFVQMLQKVRAEVPEQNDWTISSYEYTWPGDAEPSTYSYFGRMVKNKERWWILSDKYEPMVYISLNDLLRIFNKIFDIQAKELNIGFTRFETRDDKDYSEQAFATFPEHFSLRPNEALLPFNPSTKAEKDYTIKITDGNEETRVDISKVFNKVRGMVGLPTLVTGANRIGNILIEVSFILKSLDNVLDSTQGTYNVRDFIDNILSGIQLALGNVNDFGIHINHTTETASVIDRRCISHNVYGTETEEKRIIVSGPKTTITNLQVTSEISPEIAAEMSVAATAPSDGQGISKSNPDQVFWNEGCIDRHRKLDREEIQEAFMRQAVSNPLTQPEPDNYIQAPAASTPSEPKIFADASDFFTRTIKLYDVLRGGQESSKAEWGCIQQDGQTLFKSCLVRDLVTAGSVDGATESYFQSGIIPIKVGFTMKGIGRFVVGSTFKISEGLVPSKYKNWRQLITGVEHNIDKSGWKTTVSALYYPVLNKTGNIRPELGTGWEENASTYKMADNVGGGAVYGYGEGPNNVSYLDRPATKFFKKFWETHTKSSGNCAYYTAMMARSWVSSTMSNQGGWGNSDDVYLDSNGFVCSTFAKYAQNAGWQMVVEQRCVSKEFIIRCLESSDRQDGDIAIYFSVDGNARPNNKTYRHAQMRAPIKPKSWTTDDPSNFNCSFVYPKSKESLWNIYILRAPGMNRAWK